MQLSDFDLIPTVNTDVKPGDLYGRLFILLTGRSVETDNLYAISICSCGKIVKNRCDLLLRNKHKSCGCTHKKKSTHYSRWSHMMLRCFNTEHEAYPNYGGRGITVCKEWHNFETYESQLPEGYFEGAHLDRIDNDGNYEPSNVRWVSQKENNDNRRSGVSITHADRTQSMTAWANEIGVSPQVLWSRLNDHNWSVERALTTPSLDANERMALARKARWDGHVKKGPKTDRKHRTVEYQGRVWTSKQLSEHCGVPVKLLSKRLFERGWPVEKAVIPVQ